MTEPRIVGAVASLHRYPVKSMLGEARHSVTVTPAGILGDRICAFVDVQSGKIASAKRPQLWRALLSCAARTLDDADAPAIRIDFPDGDSLATNAPEAEARISALLGRPVRLANAPPALAEIDRSHPDAVLEQGLDAEVGADTLVLGQGAPPGGFVDYAPLHVITTATLATLSAGLPEGLLEPERYRANIVVRSPGASPGLPENGWLGGTLRIGKDVALRVILPTPRCAIPTLAHGRLPARPAALRIAAQRDTVDIEGFGRQPCAGVYAGVLHPGAVAEGDEVVWLPTRKASPTRHGSGGRTRSPIGSACGARRLGQAKPFGKRDTRSDRQRLAGWIRPPALAFLQFVAVNAAAGRCYAVT